MNSSSDSLLVVIVNVCDLAVLQHACKHVVRQLCQYHYLILASLFLLHYITLKISSRHFTVFKV